MTSALSALTGMARRRRSASRLAGLRRHRLPMQRIVWRQHGAALSVLLTLSAGAVAALVASGIVLRRVAAAAGTGWWRQMGGQAYGPTYPDLAMQAIPLAAALFVGVQLIARELEDGTAPFAWTQGYGKARWALGKLAAACAVLVPMAVGLGLVFGWWYRIYVPAPGYFTMHAFALYAPALAGWTIAGLALGMAAAALTRREGRAMLLTLAGWIVLHHFAIVGSPRSQPGDFWPLQFAQLAILLAISALLTGGTIALIQGAPALPGMPRLLSILPGRAAPDAQVLARRLGSRRLLAVPRAAWRQQGMGMLIALGLLGLYGAALVVTGLHIHAEPARLQPQYANRTGSYLPGAPADGIYLLPLLLPFFTGAFAGASLTGPDLGQGTVTFAWAQGVTRTRWAAGKLAAVGCVLVAAAVAVGLVFQWWDEPYIAERLAEPWFGLYAPVYAGWMAVTLTVAAFLGALTHSRAGAAVASSIGTFAAAAANAEFWQGQYLPTAVAINRPAPPGSLLVTWYLSHGQSLPNAIANRALQNFDTATAWGPHRAGADALSRHQHADLPACRPVLAAPGDPERRAVRHRGAVRGCGRLGRPTPGILIDGSRVPAHQICNCGEAHRASRRPQGAARLRPPDPATPDRPAAPARFAYGNTGCSCNRGERAELFVPPAPDGEVRAGRAGAGRPGTGEALAGDRGGDRVGRAWRWGPRCRGFAATRDRPGAPVLRGDHELADGPGRRAGRVARGCSVRRQPAAPHCGRTEAARRADHRAAGAVP